jgi:hypothetical protein
MTPSEFEILMKTGNPIVIFFTMKKQNPRAEDSSYEEVVSYSDEK